MKLKQQIIDFLQDKRSLIHYLEIASVIGSIGQKVRPELSLLRTQGCVVSDVEDIGWRLTTPDEKEVRLILLSLGKEATAQEISTALKRPLNETLEILESGEEAFVKEGEHWILKPGLRQINMEAIIEKWNKEFRAVSYLPESEGPPLEQRSLTKQTQITQSKPNNSSKLGKKPKLSCDIDSPEFRSIPISKIIPVELTSLPLFGAASLAPEPQWQEPGKGLNTTNHPYGLSLCGSVLRGNHGSLSWSSLKGLLITDFEQSLEDSEWQGIQQKLKLSLRRSAAHRTCDRESSLLPTPTTYSTPKNGSQAGQNKLERVLNKSRLPSPVAADAIQGAIFNTNTKIRYTKNGTPRKISKNGADGSVGLPRTLILSSAIAPCEVMNSTVSGWMMGFPDGWAEFPLTISGVSEPRPPTQELLKQKKPVSKRKTGGKVRPYMGELSPQPNPPLSGCESSNSSPLCWVGKKTWAVELVKQHWLESECEVWVDPFCGSLEIPLRLGIREAIVADTNPDLISFWKWVQESDAIADLPFEEWEKEGQPQYRYYKNRDHFNSTNCVGDERAQLFYWLTRHCYHSVIRYNLKGFFNSPYSTDRKPTWIKDFREIKQSIANWNIQLLSFEQVLESCNDSKFFWYCDPPYMPSSSSSSSTFTGYTKGGFPEESRDLLARILSRKTPGTFLLHDRNDPKAIALYERYQLITKPYNQSFKVGGSRCKPQELVVFKKP